MNTATNTAPSTLTVLTDSILALTDAIAQLQAHIRRLALSEQAAQVRLSNIREMRSIIRRYTGSLLMQRVGPVIRMLLDTYSAPAGSAMAERIRPFVEDDYRRVVNETRAITLELHNHRRLLEQVVQARTRFEELRDALLL
ncbi:hypothetical protein BDW22DRAFT_1349315 [Trametopsis cervina]|nr:hypothetical protein BDW22DRAFT_1349315 [Trametopsis cervina]